MPKVSVIIPTYNRKLYVQQAIDSVLSQTFTNHEIIVVDDGSTDGTGDTLIPRYGDKIRYYWQENKGESEARNRGIAEATGEYIALLDDDDIYLPEMLKVTVAFLEKTPEVGQICVQGYLVTETGELLENAVLSRTWSGYIGVEELLLKWVVLTSNSVIRREVFLKVGDFDPDIRYGEDGDLNRRIFSRYRIYYLAQPLVAFRTGEAKQSGQILNPEKAARRYADQRKALSKIDQDPLFQEFLPRLWAQVKARYGLNLMAHGKHHSAEKLLLEVFQLETSEWFYQEIMRGLVLPYMEAIDEERGIDAANDFAHHVFGVINNSNAFQSSWKRALLGEFYAARFFNRASQGDWSQMRYSYVRAILNDSTYLKNRGMHSYALRSLFRTLFPPN